MALISCNILFLNLLLAVQELPLSEVLQVLGSSQLTVPVQLDDAGHSFELLTSSVVYCVFANTEGAAWESAIRLALMPLQSIGISTAGLAGHIHTHHLYKFIPDIPKYPRILLHPKLKPKQQIKHTELSTLTQMQSNS